MSKLAPMHRLRTDQNDTLASTAVAWKVAAFELHDVIRSWGIAAYALFFAALAEGLLRFGGGSTQALVGMTSVILLIVPLVSIIFGIMYLYSAREYIELLLSQPVGRNQLFVGLYAGLIVPLSAAFAVGLSAPFLLRGLPISEAGPFLTTLLAGAFLTLVFVGFAFPVAIRNDERVRGLAIALGVWLGLTVIYDAVLLMALGIAAEYPLEIPALVATLLNPVDLARILMLLQFDVAALMGYTGAVFENFFGGTPGLGIAVGMLTFWSALPFVMGRKLFRNKDF